jgi:hypothetical protein
VDDPVPDEVGIPELAVKCLAQVVGVDCGARRVELPLRQHLVLLSQKRQLEAAGAGVTTRTRLALTGLRLARVVGTGALPSIALQRHDQGKSRCPPLGAYAEIRDRVRGCHDDRLAPRVLTRHPTPSPNRKEPDSTHA